MKKIYIFISFLALTLSVRSAAQCLQNDIILASQAEVDDFNTDYPNCKSISGTFSVIGADITNLDGLSQLTAVGRLDIKNNPVLTNLNGLTALITISSGLSIENNAALTTINGLNALTSVESMTIRNNNSLTSISGFGALTSWRGGGGNGIFINDNSALSSISGFGALTSIAASSLLIENNITLSSITGFSRLTSVSSLSIRNSAALININGFSALTSIDGYLLIGNTALINLNVLSAVRFIGGSLSIQYNPYLININGLNAVTSLGRNSFSNTNSIHNNSSLTEINLNGLTSMGTDNIGSNSVRIYSNDALTRINLNSLAVPVHNLDISIDNNNALISINFNALTSIYSLYIDNNASLTNLNGFSALTSIGGGLRIDNNAVLTSLSGLSAVTSIGFSLSIYGNPSLTSLNGLGALSSIGNLSIISNSALTNLNGLGTFTFINGNLDIRYNSALTNLNALSTLTSIRGSLIFENNVVLPNLNGLSALTSVNGPIIIQNNAALTNLTALSGLTSVHGNLTILENAALTSLDGLGAITSIDQDLYIWSNAVLTNLNNLSSLTSISGSLSIRFNTALVNLDGLNSLTSIGGSLNIQSNTALTNLNGLNSLTSINVNNFGGILSIISNNTLTSLSGLDNINPNSITNLFIQYNTQLSECALQNTCNYLLTGNKPYSIINNALGCRTREQIRNICEERDRCNAPINVKLTGATANSFLFSWDAVNRATLYNIDYKKSSETNWTTVTATTNNKALLNLMDNTNYDIRISTYCSNGRTSVYSTIINFNTKKATITDATTCTIGSFPLDFNGTYAFSGNNYFRTDATGINYYIAFNISNNRWEMGYAVNGTGFNDFALFINPSTNPSAIPCTGWTSSSSCSTNFTLSPCADASLNCTTLSNPPPNAPYIPVTSSLTWAAVPNATGYRISIGTTSGGTDIANNIDVGNATTYHPLSNLPPLTLIYVFITPYNTFGDAQGCSIQSFRTGQNTVPSCAILSNPTPNATNIATNTAISWTSATNNTTGYRISMEVSGGVGIAYNLNVGNVTTYQPQHILPANATIDVEITAYNALGDAENCQFQSFTTNQVIPSNDDCATAQVLSIGTAVNGSTTSASSSFTDCISPTNHDVWYRFTATATNHIVTVTPTTADPFSVYIESGNCANQNCIASEDNSVNAPLIINLLDLTIGDVYYIAVDQFDNNYAVNFSVKVTDATNCTFTGAIDNNWNDGRNWSCLHVPTTNDSVTVNNKTVIVDADAECRGLRLEGMNAIITHPSVLSTLTANNLDWRGGTIDNPLTIAPNGILTTTGTAFILSSKITNHGTTTISGKINFTNGTFKNNNKLVVANNTAEFSNTTGVNAFNNCGVISSLSGNTLTIGVPYNECATAAQSVKLMGIGTLTYGSNYVLSGTVAPGNSPGKLTISPSVTATSTAVFDMEINAVGTAGTDYDQLAITGDFVSGGTIRLTFTNNFNPSFGTFDLITYAGNYSGSIPALTCTDSRFNFSRVSLVNNVTAKKIQLIVLGQALPAELVSFKGKNTEGGNLLTWQIASEVNTLGFDIERSNDGKIFEKIGFAKAKGSNSNYEFLDIITSAKFETLPTLTTYYRLKINDLDGKTSYSNVVSVAAKGKGLTAKIFPNPFSDNLTLDISTEKKAEITIDVIDILGRSVRHLTLNTEGSLNVPISTKDLPSGTYFLKISDGQTIIQQKIMRQ